ncbi:2OG-Fe(II) oxygenase family protein [Candidatus Pelagibacter sp.]|nr:2OG-Fe(II) oxygenase family protein [Candidatus Pelagibacter sp.]|tara:strand:- start:901 stop:1536 length:636 start_codon:yes stop_codon:yes gene_type:complete
MEAKFIKTFGPSIVKAKIPEKLLNDLNEYVDKIIEDKEKAKKLDLGPKLAGDVTQEIQLEGEFAKKIGWLQFLANVTSEWIKFETGKKISEFNVTNSWVVRQFKNEYNPIHWHSGHISGAGFLKVPKTLGSHLQDKGDKKYSGGNLNLIHGSNMFLSRSMYEIKPEVGDFYFFPHYVMHTVYPFKGTEEERRSISFNATIDERIYDVYGKY